MSGSALLAAVAAACALLAAADLLALAAAAIVAVCTSRGRRSGPGHGPWRPGRRRGERGPASAAGLFVVRLGVPLQEGLVRRLAAAGITREGAVAEVMAAKLVLAAAGLVFPLARGGGGSLASLALPVAAFLLPDVWLARRATLRARALVRGAPELLDRVRLAADAGLAPQRALAAAVAGVDGLLSREIAAALASCDLGLSREAALARLTARCPVPEVAVLVAVIRRSSLHGTALGPSLGALALSSRAERARRLEERAQRAAPQIQLVVALVLVPAAMLLIGAALVAKLA